MDDGGKVIFFILFMAGFTALTVAWLLVDPFKAGLNAGYFKGSADGKTYCFKMMLKKFNINMSPSKLVEISENLRQLQQLKPALIDYAHLLSQVFSDF